MNLLRIFKVATLITNKVFNVKTINIKNMMVKQFF